MGLAVLQDSSLTSLLMLSPLHTMPPASEAYSVGTVLTLVPRRSQSACFSLLGLTLHIDWVLVPS